MNEPQFRLSDAEEDEMFKKAIMNAKKKHRNELFAAYLQGKRDQIYWETKWEDLHPIGKYRVKKKFLKWYHSLKV